MRVDIHNERPGLALYGVIAVLGLHAGQAPAATLAVAVLARVERHRASGVLWIGGVSCDAMPVPDTTWSFSTDAYDAAAARSGIDEANARARR
jgi:hypothetical protein